jgi:hypothetical protein
VFTPRAAASSTFIASVEILVHWNSKPDVRRFRYRNPHRLTGRNKLEGSVERAWARFGSGQYRRWAEASSMHPTSVWGALDCCQMPQIACVHVDPVGTAVSNEVHKL